MSKRKTLLRSSTPAMGLALAACACTAAAQIDDTPAMATPQAAPPASTDTAAAGNAEAAPPLATIATPEPAADAESAAAAEPRLSNRVLEEVVVTAQKRAENIMSVPISIQAFSADSLEARGANDPQDLKFVTPGLVYDNLVGYSLIYMRGVGTDVFLPNSEPSVATYIDGVYFPFSQGLAQEFTKLDHIEVLKGPQGTLFGRNATGGAINVIAKKPSDQFEFDLDAGVRSFAGRSSKAYLNIPVGAGLSVSFSGLYDKDHPYYKLAPSSPLQHLAPNVSEGFNPRIHWQITDNLSALISGYFAGTHGTGATVNTNIAPKPAGVLLGVVDAGDRTASVNAPETMSSRSTVIYGNIEWITDFANLKLLGSNTKAHTDTRWDYDAGPNNVAYFYPYNQYLNSRTGELQIVSNPNTPWADHLEWTAGLYYFHSEGGFDNPPIEVGVVNLHTPGPLGQAFAGLQSAVSGLTSSLGLGTFELPQGAVGIFLTGVIQTDALAGYAQAKYSPTDWVSLTAGARYQDETRKMVKSTTQIDAVGIPAVYIDWLARNQYKTTRESLSPRIALDFNFIKDTLLYASWSEATKSGTYNIVNIYTPPGYIKPETDDSYELGIKGHLFGNDLRYTVAVFDNKITNLQTLNVSLLQGGAISLANAGSATIYGAEFDTTWRALPDLLPGFAILMSGTWLHGEYTSFPEGQGFDPATGVAFGPNGLGPARDFSGNRTVRTPKFTGSFGLSYSFSAPGGTVEVGSDVYYNSGYFFDTQNTVEQPRYYTLNARASYLYEPWDLRVSVYGKNLTDQFYYLNAFATDFGVNATAAAPTTWGVGLSWTLQ